MADRLLRADPIPTPQKAKPEIGTSAAYQIRAEPMAPVVTGRAVVVIVSVDETGLVFGVTGLVENVHAAPVGSPAEHPMETLFGNPNATRGLAVT